MRATAALLALLCCISCERSEAPHLGAEKLAASSGTRPKQTPEPAGARAKPNAATAHSGEVPPRAAHETPTNAPPQTLASVRQRYAWLEGADAVPPPVDTLVQRFPAPDGFQRLPLQTQSFAAFLRTLPLAAADTPVQSYNGGRILDVGDPRYAAVVALDVGKADLQQCADAVMRLHGEWRWSAGARDMSYRAAAGLPIAYARYRRGERLVPQGSSLSWRGGGQPSDSYATFRKYMNTVFAWANTVSLMKQSTPVAYADLHAGDFFVLPGNPGHTVLILDVVVRGTQKRALLGQSYMPAQNFQVLRPRAGAVWFELDPTQSVKTPFWAPFPWTSLRRL